MPKPKTKTVQQLGLFDVPPPKALKPDWSCDDPFAHLPQLPMQLEACDKVCCDSCGAAASVVFHTKVEGSTDRLCPQCLLQIVRASGTRSTLVRIVGAGWNQGALAPEPL